MRLRSCERGVHEKMCFLFFNDTATTEIYTLSLHDALPIFEPGVGLVEVVRGQAGVPGLVDLGDRRHGATGLAGEAGRSEEHTSELQSRQYLVCRLLLEKKKKHVASVCT